MSVKACRAREGAGRMQGAQVVGRDAMAAERRGGRGGESTEWRKVGKEERMEEERVGEEGKVLEGQGSECAYGLGMFSMHTWNRVHVPFRTQAMGLGVYFLEFSSCIFNYLV